MSSTRDFLRLYWPFAAVAFLGVLVTWIMMDPAPPKKITFASGAPGGAYHVFAERYQRLLAESGVEVELIETQGSIDNIRLLVAGEADAGLVQGGLAKRSDAEELRSLGGLFAEPFWVFVRNDIPAEDFGDLRRARMAIGGPGSGTRMLALAIQSEFAGNWRTESQNALGGTEAAEALISGEVDAAAFSASVSASYIQLLLKTDSVRLLEFDQAPALARRQDALSSVILLQGVVDVGAHLPEKDVQLVAPVAQLAIRKELHPAIEALLIDAAAAIHSEASLLAPAGTYPDPTVTDLPVTRQARRYYQDGPSFLRRYFSFGWANFLERAWVLAIPLLTLLFPLVRAAPPIYRWRVRRKIYVWYGDLRELESEGRAATTAEDRQSVLDELERLQVEIGTVDVPLSYTDDLYRLRSHVEFVKHLVGEKEPAASPVGV